MAGPLHYMPVMTREYLSSAAIRTMSLAARGLYDALRFAQWEEGCLPSDPALLCRLVGADRREFERAWKEIRHLLTGCADGGLVFEDVARQRAEAVAKVEKHAANGAKGGRPRKVADGTRTEPGRNHMVPSDGTISETESEPNPNSNTLSETEGASEPSEEDRAERRFQSFLSWFKLSYPRRGPNGIYKWNDVETRLRSIVGAGIATTGELSRGLLGWKAVAEASKNANTDFISTPSKWLEEKGWLDEYPVVLKVESGGKAERTPGQMHADMMAKAMAADGGR